MLTAKPVPLTAKERDALQAAAAYHGSLARLRLERLVRLVGRFSLLVLAIGAVLLPVLWLLAGPSRLAAPLLAFGLVALLMLAGVAAVAQAGVQYEHEALLRQQSMARDRAGDAHAELVTLSLDSDCLRLRHEHGAYFIVADGHGGAVVFDIASVGGDPRERMARADRVPTVWSWRQFGDRIRSFRTGGKAILLKEWDRLDEVDPAAVYAALGLDDVPVDRQALPYGPAEALRRLERLGKPPA